MHPIILRLFGPVKIHSYGLMLALAFLTAVWLAQRDAKRKGFDPDAVGDMAIWLLISGVLGARLMFVILNPALFSLSKPFDFLKIWEGGLVFYGGVIAAIPVAIFLLKKSHYVVVFRVDGFEVFIDNGHSQYGCVTVLQQHVEQSGVDGRGLAGEIAQNLDLTPVFDSDAAVAPALNRPAVEAAQTHGIDSRLL